MKRRQLLDHLKSNGCEFFRAGSNHDIYRNIATGKRTAVPRHREIDNLTARKICDQLGAPRP